MNSSKRWRVNNPLNYLISKARERAKSAGLDFNITPEDINIPTHCPVLGIPLFYSNTGRVGANSPSIDRIQNELGYVKGNVIVVSWRANTLKKDATISEMISLANFYAPLLT